MNFLIADTFTDSLARLTRKRECCWLPFPKRSRTRFKQS
jgi:hypothetical protein